MGLSKTYESDSGVPLKYHRIVVLTQHVNVATIIEVQSYTSEGKRIEEQEIHAANVEAGGALTPFNGYTEGEIINIPYDPDMTVARAYAYLKTLDKYQGAEDVIDKWAAETSYYTGDVVMHGDDQYECIQPHTSQADWTPDATPALWAKVTPEGEIPVWEQPDSTNAFMTGDKVHYPTADDPVYESTIDNNVWSPEAYPQGWRLVEGGE